MNVIFTARSLHACIENAPSCDWFGSLAVPSTGEWGVLSAAQGSCRYVAHREDPPNTPKIAILGGQAAIFEPAPKSAWLTMAQRVHRAFLSARTPPLRLPPDWGEFHDGNLVAFFATSRSQGAFRWIAEIGVQGTDDMCFWMLTDSDKKVLLQDFEPDTRCLAILMRGWNDAFSELRNAFAQLPVPAKAVALQAAVDLDAATFGAVTQHRTYTAWLEHLTRRQRAFVEDPSSHSVKLRGPAGSGKTLALELKLLRELYAAQDEGRAVRILFATHSWAVAEQVDAALQALDERGDLSGVEVFPLVEIAKAVLPAERGVAGARLLGEDSLSGKRLQLQQIDQILDRLAKGDWLAYRSRASRQFKARVEAAAGTPERNAFVWDLMNEFACVLSAHGILPGINAERRYLALPRGLWMMPLETDADKRFVLAAYTDYVNSFKREGILTSDQLINDTLNYLETFTWNLRREESGYDLVFVDELHLFSEQERLVLHYLARDADSYPRLFMALDPRQAASEIYLPVASVATGHSGAADQSLGVVNEVDLTVVHRFSPEILRLVQHFHRSYPALDLGADWQVSADSLESSAKSGALPVISVHRTGNEEVRAVLARATNLSRSIKASERVAVVLLDPLLLEQFDAGTGGERTSFCVIQSRDDVDTLRYRRKSIVLSAAEYVGGLQFDCVLVAGFPPAVQGVANLGHQRRRFLSLLYLAVSRARNHVEIHVNDQNGGIPELLEAAVAAGLLKRGELS